MPTRNASAGKRPRRRTAEQWLAIVDRFQKSGLKERDFCKRENLAESSFARWRRQLLAGNRRPEFVELRPTPAAPDAPDGGTWTIEIDLPGGGGLRIRGGR
jgi:hypothetical protein